MTSESVHSSINLNMGPSMFRAKRSNDGAGPAPRLVGLCAPAWAGRCVAPGLSLSVGLGIVPFLRVLFFFARARGGRPSPPRPGPPPSEPRAELPLRVDLELPSTRTLL